MSATSETADRDAHSLTEAEVVEFLRARPDFLIRNPDLVVALTVPHGFAGAASLVEYRASLLKEETDTLEKRLALLLDNARDNEERSERLHRLTLRLLESDRLDEMLGGVYSSIREEFGVELTAIKFVGRPRSVSDAVLGEVVRPGSAAFSDIEALSVEDAPRCGVFDPVLLEALFGDRHHEVGSAAIFSLGPKVGVMALASADRSRFRAGMGTLFLRRLADLVSRAAGAYLAIE